MTRGLPLIDANSSLTPALMPVSPLRFNLLELLNCSLPPIASMSDGEMPCKIWRAISEVRLLLLPISTVPRLPGDPVPCGYVLTSTQPSEPDSTCPVAAFHL